MSEHVVTLVSVLASVSSHWPGLCSSASGCFSYWDLANIHKLFLILISNYCFSSGESKVGFGFGLPGVHKAPAGFGNPCHRLYLYTVASKHKVTMAVV